jgi:DNA-binding response OmpR family regulator
MPTAEPQRRSLVNRAGSIRRALLVDDDEQVRTLAATWLTQAGFDVTTASAFSEGHAQLMTDHPDVIVVDVRLGDYNGLQLAITARERDPGTRIVVMSAWDDAVLRRDARQCGAIFLTKPFSSSQLLEAIADL